MTVIKHVIGWYYQHQYQNEKDDGYAFVRLRLLHHATIVGKRVVGRQFLEELGIYLIIIMV